MDSRSLAKIRFGHRLFFSPWFHVKISYRFFLTDHSYVYLELSPPSGIRRGRGVWKFNAEHLRDPDFATVIDEWNHTIA